MAFDLWELRARVDALVPLILSPDGDHSVGVFFDYVSRGHCLSMIRDLLGQTPRDLTCQSAISLIACLTNQVACLYWCHAPLRMRRRQ